MKKLVFIVMLLMIVGCKRNDNHPAIQIALVDSDKHLKISGLDYAILQDINRDTTINIWQNLIQVYRMPADTDLKDFQPVQPPLVPAVVLRDLSRLM